nr:ribonuclease H-like domain, reverse transcriptase, RNA-dependent DNA polymerase [Tanacetum cinerariifolium]
MSTYVSFALFRVSKKEETKYRDYVHEERKPDKVPPRTREKISQKDGNVIDGISLERHPRSDAGSSLVVDICHISPSSTSNEPRHSNRPDVRRNLDAEEIGSRSVRSKDAKEYSNNHLGSEDDRSMPFPGHGIQGSHGFANWDHMRPQLNNQVWESNADMPSSAQKNDHSVQEPTDKVLTGVTETQIENEENQPVVNTLEVLKVADQCKSMLNSNLASVSDESNFKILFLEAEAIRHAIHILNSIPTKALEDVTSYEAIKQRKPNLENLRIFGCIAYAKVLSQHLTKLDDRSIKMVYLGNEQGSKGVYVDDLIITGAPKKEIEKFKAQMEEKFEMSDLGLLAYYLGIEVTQTNGDISIKQSDYASKILKEAEMLDCNETLIPMDPGIRLTKITEGTMVNSTEYRSIIGCLRYLLHTRPDLSCSVGLLSHFMQEPKEQHMKAIRQVLRYVKGTKDYGITYKHNGGNKIHGFSDSRYGVNTQEGKGTTGIIFYYGESPIS